MKNSNLNNEYLDDEIDLKELIRTILNSKKIIIIVTLAFSLLALIYTTQKEAEYQSSIILEVGSYRLLSGEKKSIETVSNLIKKLKVDLVYKKQLEFDDLKLNDKELKFKSIEDELLQINYTSPSLEFSESVIKEAIKFAQESHTETLNNIVNSFYNKIVTIDNEVEFIKNSIKIRQESQKYSAINAIKTIDNEVEFQKLNAINSIKALDKEIEFLKNSIELNAINAIKLIDNDIPALKDKIKYLLKLIPEEEENLLLLKSDTSVLVQRASSSPTLQQVIYSYNEEIISLGNQIQNLQQEKDDLEMQVKSIAEGEFKSEKLFKLQQEKDVLEMQVKSIEEGEFESKELFKLQQAKENLEKLVKPIAEGEFTSEKLFKLQQEKDTLEMQIKLVNNQKNKTGLIHKVVTQKVKSKTPSTILISTILGFIFSIFIVFIRQALLKEQN